MKKKFNLKGYQELVEMQNRGEIVFLDTNYFKLLRYSTSVMYQCMYNRKEEYYSIIHNYLNKTLTLDEFQTQFLNLQDEDIDKKDVIFGNIEEIKVFYLVEDLEEFSKLISQIIILCEEFDIIEPIPETEFYYCVNKYYYPLQVAFPSNTNT